MLAWAAVAVGIVAFAASWFRHATFRSSSFDLGVYEQVVWKMAHGHGATSTLVGWNTFADHLSPILLAFVPLYRIVATPLWFFAAQAAAFAVGLMLLPAMLTAAGLPARHHRPLFLAYLLSPLMWNAVLFDFHTSTLAVPVLIFGITAALRHDRRGMVLAVVGLALLRDDVAAAGACIALIGWRSDSPGRRFRVGLAVGSLAWVAFGSALGSAMGADRYWTERYGYLGTSATDAILHPLHTIPALLAHLATGQNLTLALFWMLPFALLPLVRPAYALLTGFVALPVLIANDANFHSMSFHYGAPLLPFLVLCAAVTVARQRTPRRQTMCGAMFTALSVASFVLVGPFMVSTLRLAVVAPGDARAAVATIRPGDVVVATSFLGPHVAHRKTLFPYPSPFMDADRNFPLNPSVTRLSGARQAAVDVVIVSKAAPRFARLHKKFAELPQIRRDFRVERFGTVTLYRRVKPAA